MSEWQPFNLNETVRVKLTDYGREVHKQNHTDFWARAYSALPKPPEPTPYCAPKEDADGYSTWQAWVLFNEFGHVLTPGGKIPFELTIEIKTPVQSGSVSATPATPNAEQTK